MPPISNPQAVLVANTKLRPLADMMAGLYLRCKAAQAEAQAENWAVLFPNTADLVVDGSETDGRTPITGADLTTFIATITAFITDMEQTSNAKRNNALKIAPNPQI